MRGRRRENSASNLPFSRQPRLVAALAAVEPDDGKAREATSAMPAMASVFGMSPNRMTPESTAQMVSVYMKGATVRASPCGRPCRAGSGRRQPAPASTISRMLRVSGTTGVSKASMPMPPASEDHQQRQRGDERRHVPRGARRDQVARGGGDGAEEGEHGIERGGTAAGLGHQKGADDADEDQHHARQAQLLAPEDPGAQQHEERGRSGRSRSDRRWR